MGEKTAGDTSGITTLQELVPGVALTKKDLAHFEVAAHMVKMSHMGESVSLQIKFNTPVNKIQ